jgi:hypothetical protein
VVEKHYEVPDGVFQASGPRNIRVDARCELDVPYTRQALRNRNFLPARGQVKHWTLRNQYDLVIGIPRFKLALNPSDRFI